MSPLACRVGEGALEGRIPWLKRLVNLVEAPAPATAVAGARPGQGRAAGDPMSPAGGLGQPIAGDGLQHKVDGVLHVDEMTRRDVQRLAAGLRAHDGANQAGRHVLAVEAGGLARLGARLGVAPVQARLGNPDGGPLKPQPEVGGDPQAARVGNPLAVEQDEVGPGAELVPGGQDGRGLAEAGAARGRMGRSAGQRRRPPRPAPGTGSAG